MEHLIIILSRCLFLLSKLTFFYLLFLLIVLFTLLIGFFPILIVFRILRDKILQLFIVTLQFLLVLSFKEFVCLNGQYFSIWILWKQLVEFVAYADECLEYSFMRNLYKSNFKDTWNIMLKHVSHQNICISPISLSETHWNVIDDCQIAFKDFETCVKIIYFELFLFLSCCLSEQGFVNKFEMSRLDNILNLGQIELYLFCLDVIFGLF